MSVLQKNLSVIGVLPVNVEVKRIRSACFALCVHFMQTAPFNSISHDHTPSSNSHTSHSPGFQSVPAFWPSFFFCSTIWWEHQRGLLSSPVSPWLPLTPLQQLSLSGRCLLITSATIVSGQVGSGGGVPSIHTAIFSHEAKALYSSRNGDLNTPDSYIHCLVTQCATGFNPPHFVQAPITAGCLVLQCWMGLPCFFFFPPFSPLYFYSSQQ